MCGITGIILNKSIKGNKYNKLISSMTDLIKHRGPDQSGTYTSENVFLGHRRLSILDLSENGRQPMADDKDEIVITFNGEIYNFLDIKKELSQKYKFKSSSDTEVLIYAYKEWGIEFVRKLNGMFAFIIYDKLKDKIYVVRDRLGIKPLYIYQNSKGYFFSSEIKSLLKCLDKKPTLDLKSVSSYLSYRYPLGKDTFFNEIKSLKPGFYYEISKNDFIEEQYWRLTLNDKYKSLSYSECKSKVSELFKKAVSKRMISDVPIGAYLSGGLDSSGVVSVMAKNSNLPVKTFTIGFDVDGFNEFEYSKQVADMHKTDHHEINLSSEKYFETMKTLIKYKDAPLGVPNEVPLYLMSKELKKYITVVLSGEGADEIFIGYGRLFSSTVDYKRMRFLSKFPVLAYIPIFNKMKNSLLKKYGRLNFENEFDHFMSQYTYFPLDEKIKLFDKKVAKEINKDLELQYEFKTKFNEYPQNDYASRISYVFELLHLPGLLQRVDICTMATSVEARVPFVDHELVEFVLNIPTQFKLNWKSYKHFFSSLTKNSSEYSEFDDVSKKILRDVLKNDLPPEILIRKKQGFPVPLNAWFKGDFINLAKKELLSKNSKVLTIFNKVRLEKWIDSGKSDNFGQKLWMILNLELFLREYF